MFDKIPYVYFKMRFILIISDVYCMIDACAVWGINHLLIFTNLIQILKGMSDQTFF